MNKQTITINNTVYDKYTGMPIRDNSMAHKSTSTALSSHPNPHHAQAVHKKANRSETLNRRYIKHATKSPVTTQTLRPRGALNDIKPAPNTHPQVRKFAPHPADIAASKKPLPKKTIDVQPITHPIAQAAHHKQAQRLASPSSSPKPSQMIKREAEAKALAEATPNKRNRHKTKQKQSRSMRLVSLASAGASLLLIGGYFTYINMPNLSVRVAAAQAGIEAEYPSYRPSGYSLAGPIAYDSGTVSMKFAMHGSPKSFTLNQSRSGWDSSAVLDNYIQPKAGNAYITTQDKGLTIYSFDNNAAWVNNGILYTVEGDAPISLEQIRRIATSM